MEAEAHAAIHHPLLLIRAMRAAARDQVRDDGADSAAHFRALGALHGQRGGVLQVGQDDIDCCGVQRDGRGGLLLRGCVHVYLLQVRAVVTSKSSSGPIVSGDFGSSSVRPYWDSAAQRAYS